MELIDMDENNNSKIDKLSDIDKKKQKENEEMLELDRLKALEEEQENLNASLMSLTTHFAQVQFRLKQIIAAPSENREVIFVFSSSSSYYYFLF